jgi:hypothetical protein
MGGDPASRRDQGGENLWGMDRWPVCWLFERAERIEKDFASAGRTRGRRRQAGYKEFSQKVGVQPGEKHIVRVVLEKDLRMQIPTITSEIKLSVVRIEQQCLWTVFLWVTWLSLVGLAERYWSRRENARSQSVCPDLKPSRQSSLSWRIKNSKSKLELVKSGPQPTPP